MQNVIELENGKSAMKLTTAGYLRPSGKNIDRDVAKEQGSEDWGVRPDEGFEVRLGDGEMTRLYRDRQRRDIVQVPRQVGRREAGREARREARRQGAGRPAVEQGAGVFDRAVGAEELI